MWEPSVAKDFYLVRDLQAVTGLGKQTIYAAIEAGELPGYKAGTRYVVPGPAFRAFCEGTWVPLPMRIRHDNAIEAPDVPRDPSRFLIDISERRHVG